MQLIFFFQVKQSPFERKGCIFFEEGNFFFADELYFYFADLKYDSKLTINLNADGSSRLIFKLKVKYK